MRPLVVIENQFIEVPAAGLLAYVGVNHIRSEFVEGNGIRQRFAAGLEGEGDRDVTDGEALAVDGADAHAPVVGAHAGQLRDVARHLPLRVGLAPPVEVLDVLGEAGEVRDDELVSERSRDEDHVGLDHAPKRLPVQLLSLRRAAFIAGFAVDGAEVLAEFRQAGVVLSQAGLPQGGQELADREQVVIFVLEHVEEDVLRSLGPLVGVPGHHVADVMDEGHISTGGRARGAGIELGELFDARLQVGESSDPRAVERSRLNRHGCDNGPRLFNRGSASRRHRHKSPAPARQTPRRGENSARCQKLHGGGRALIVL